MGKGTDHPIVYNHDPDADVLSIIKNITRDSGQDEAEPFYVCDVGDIINKHKHWKETMPRVETFYAVKCNDDETVLQTLAALGTGFDCASKQEIHKLLTTGVGPDRIIFANSTKPISHVKYAATKGVSMMTFDNEQELYKIKKWYPDAELVIRIKYDDLSAKYIFGEKFGCDPETEAADLLKIARSLKLNVIGVSFHIGSGSEDTGIYKYAIDAARQVFDLAKDFNYDFKLLDLGGGFPGTKDSSIKEIGETINEALEINFSDSSIRIIAEPGRYYVSSAFTLATSIHSLKIIHLPGDSNQIQMYYVTAGIYGALLSVVFDEYYEARPLTSISNAKLYPSVLWGPTGDGFDKISENVMLPEMCIGDWIIFYDAGAYTMTLASAFNGFPVPKIHTVIDRNRFLEEASVMENGIKKGKIIQY